MRPLLVFILAGVISGGLFLFAYIRFQKKPENPITVVDYSQYNRAIDSLKFEKRKYERRADSLEILLYYNKLKQKEISDKYEKINRRIYTMGTDEQIKFLSDWLPEENSDR